MYIHTSQHVMQDRRTIIDIPLCPCLRHMPAVGSAPRGYPLGFCTKIAGTCGCSFTRNMVFMALDPYNHHMKLARCM